MVLFKDKRFITNSEHPDNDWTGHADFVIPDGSELAQKIIGLYPNFDFVFDDDGNISDVIETEPEPLPPEPPVPPTNAELAAAIAELAEVMYGG